MTISRNIVDPVTFGATNIAKPRSFQQDTLRQDLQHSTGADQRISDTEALAVGDLVVIGYDDAASYSALRARVNQEDTLTVKSLNVNSQTAGIQFVIANARLLGVGVNAGHARPMELTATFVVRAPDGQADPITVTPFA